MSQRLCGSVDERLVQGHGGNKHIITQPMTVIIEPRRNFMAIGVLAICKSVVD